MILDEGLRCSSKCRMSRASAACARAPFQEFSVEHINYFSAVSLTSLAGAAGFTGVPLESDGDPVEERLTRPGGCWSSQG